MTPADRRYSEVRPLSADHLTGEFDCGYKSETIWLRRHALHAQAAGTSRVYVACRTDDLRVAGFHALAAGAVDRRQVPVRVGRGIGRHPIPVILLTTLGVDRGEHGRGLGKALVVDALRRVDAAADSIGARALLVHAEDPRARDFYLHLAEFEPSPTDPLHLFLLMKDLRRALG